MRTEIQTYHRIEEDLKLDYPDLTDYERLSIAVQIQRNQLIENGLNVSTDDSKPSALEAIAIALGYTSPSSITINDNLADLVKNTESK
ncbi:histidine kinase [Chryseobacterium gleum]|uniref:histidine kinase n=1 Tax=Chryseobacterium gleum TaxID=250 RepID=UPI001E5BE523|nr:histidine kinase [Chryseobacterium gleum]MCE4064346.1 histidine kinase [Chryseobacterium gleum]